MNNTTKIFVNRYGDCFSFFRSLPKDVENISVTAVYACLIPSIIVANLFSIIGIIKTKKNKYNSSQILFLALFLSDMTIGAVQLPLEIYLVWKLGSPTCVEINLSQVLLIFTITMSGNILCVIPIDRYIHVAQSRRHKQIVTNKILASTIILMIFISFTWAVSTTLFYKNSVFFVFVACEVIIFMLGVWFNVGILMNVRLRTKNSTAQHTALNASLTKTISLIVAMMLITYIPLLVHLSITQYATRNWTNFDATIKVVKNVRWTMIPSQLNAVLNSVIYVSRNSRMKRYYCNFFNCTNNKEWKIENLTSCAEFNIRNKWLVLSSLFVERAFISNRLSLISIVRRLGAAKTTAKHKFKFWMLKHTLRENKKKLNYGCYQQVVPPEGCVRKSNSWFEDWTPPLTEALVRSIL